ncbi:Aldo/keto reductase [Fistulina hepatica ATCC 64428]|nr:Aldo/keto reductase [Fistulina hepatica ATCC 64428]
MPLSPRKIGDVLVPPIGYGAMGLSAFLGTVGTDEERFEVLDAVYAKGCTHWDSANVYGDSEDLLGKWFKRTGKRGSIFLATKFGIEFSLEDGVQVRADPEYVKQCCNKSLERLGVDYIDLYYQHRPDAKVPIEVSVGAMAELVQEGKVKYLGLSEVSANDLRRAYAVHPIAALQIEFSPFLLDTEGPRAELFKAAKELGVTIVVFSPLGRGLLTGQYKSPDDFGDDDFRKSYPKFSKENFPKILDIVEYLKEIGKKHNATPGQVTLAWVLAQGDHFVAIPGTKKIKYLEENVGAADVVLTPEEIKAIRAVAEVADFSSLPRYGKALQIKMVNVETPRLKQ